MNNPRYKVELFLTAVTPKAKNKSFIDLDSFLVQMLHEEGLQVESIRSQRSSYKDWYKCPH